MMRLAALLALVTACGSHAETATPSPSNAQMSSPAVDAGVPVPVITASHSAAIAQLAITDDAKAALTRDDNGELRFWPTLDGLHEPVAIRARASVDVVLARTPDGFIAALLDNAGGVEVIELSRDGHPRARRVISADPGIEELVATSTAILARRTDQTLVRLDVPSQALAPQMGEQILAIAARRNIAVAALADPEHPEEVHEVRQIALARDLGWGAAYTLPVPLQAPIAVSPSGRRIAGIHARSGAATIIELLGQPRVVASDNVGESDDGLLGFLDDERAVFRAGVVLSVPKMTATLDPWAATTTTTRLRTGRVPAVGDSVVISGLGTHLMLADGANTLFLGYRDIGPGLLRVTPNAITLAMGNRVLWLDEDLHDRRARDVANDAMGGLPVDDHRLLKGTYTYLESDRSKLDVALLDASSGLEVQLGTWPQTAGVTYDPHTRVLAMTGYTTTIPRALLDIDNAKVKPLRPLATRRDANVELFDAGIADGVVAVATSYDQGAFTIETFVDDHKRSTKPLAPTSTLRLPDAMLVGFDRTATLYVMELRNDRPTHLAVYRGRKQVKRWPIDASAALSTGAVNRAGTQIAAFTSSSELALFDVGGHERWRVPMWAGNTVRFTDDGGKLIVNTGGGLVTVDAATGARIATACGWGFGLSTTEPSLSIYNTAVVCAEASR